MDKYVDYTGDRIIVEKINGGANLRLVGYDDGGADLSPLAMLWLASQLQHIYLDIVTGYLEAQADDNIS